MALCQSPWWAPTWHIGTTDVAVAETDMAPGCKAELTGVIRELTRGAFPDQSTP